MAQLMSALGFSAQLAQIKFVLLRPNVFSPRNCRSHWQNSLPNSQIFTIDRDSRLPKGRMGRQGAALRINPKKFGNLQKPCMREMISFLNCLALSQGNDARCSRQKSLLSACMDAQTANKRKPWGSINYHLQRLSRGKK